MERQCPNCLTPIVKRPDFCLNCGDYVAPIYVRAHGTRRSSPRRHSRAVLLGVILLTLAVGAIVTITVCDVVKSADRSPDRAYKTALGYIQKGEYENAINVLDQSLHEEKAAKNDRRPGVLDQALFDLAGKLAQEGKYRDAVTNYSRISRNFSRREEVDKLIAEYSDKALPIVFGNVEGAPSQAPKSASMSRMEKAVQTVVPASTKASINAVVQVEPPLQSTAPRSGNSNSALANPSPPPGKPGMQTLKPAISPEAEDSQTLLMSRYNELLAGYFSHRKGDAAEPPSYDEWVKSGGRDF